MTDQAQAEEQQTFQLHDSTIAGLMQLLTLAMGTGTNLLDHFRMLELMQGDDGKLVMTPDFISRTESLAADIMKRLEEGRADQPDQPGAGDEDSDGPTPFGFV